MVANGRVFLLAMVLVASLSLGCSSVRETTYPLARGAQDELFIVSIADQRLTVVRDGRIDRSYIVGTAQRGVSNSPNSYATPTGFHYVAELYGAGQAIGTPFESHEPVLASEVAMATAAGDSETRWPIITRIIRLAGGEYSNRLTYERLIYIHGTPFEMDLGMPASGGCIRMRSADVVDLFSLSKINSLVLISEKGTAEALTDLAEWRQATGALEAAVDAGDVKAASTLCSSYALGTKGTPIDGEKAIKYCSISDSAGDSMAAALIGQLNHFGLGNVEKNLPRAVALYRDAANGGNGLAQFRLYQMFEAGEGVEQNANASLYFLNLAAQHGYPDARRILAASQRHQK